MYTNCFFVEHKKPNEEYLKKKTDGMYLLFDNIRKKL